MKLLLDTSIVIDYLRRKDRESTKLVEIVREHHHLYISIITHTELFSGKSIWENEKRYETLEKLCLGFTILPVEEDISMKAGKIRAYYPTDLFDAIIAATALHNNIPLVTLNTKDFEKIEGLELF